MRREALLFLFLMQPEWTGATAPPDWYYSLFPLTGDDVEEVATDWVMAVSDDLLHRAAVEEDEAHLGPVLHWAHLLKVAQGPEGDWPARFNARTGAAIGAERTRSPGALFERLGELLDSTEFEYAARLARPLSRPSRG